MVDKNYIIFTDLDGTLLDHQTYRYDAANTALDLIRAAKIPLILTSSKTAAELVALRAELGFEHCPAIVENGAGILNPGAIETNSDDQYQNILTLLINAPEDLRSYFKGFSDYSAQELSELTSLDIKSAELAMQRQYSEPGTWSGSDDELAVFETYLTEHGLSIQQGGRFLSVSTGMNKADRMMEILTKNRSTTPDIVSIALGDAPNDIMMLEMADIGFVIKNTDGHDIFKGDMPHHIIRSNNHGPIGWNQCINSLLNQSSSINLK
jgi:mannosyl-3-phosphoglycerate phosphatase